MISLCFFRVPLTESEIIAQRLKRLPIQTGVSQNNPKARAGRIIQLVAVQQHRFQGVFPVQGSMAFSTADAFEESIVPARARISFPSSTWPWMMFSVFIAVLLPVRHRLQSFIRFLPVRSAPDRLHHIREARQPENLHDVFIHMGQFQDILT